MLTRKFYHRLLQILPFGIIWLLFALVYFCLEYGIIGNTGIYPSTGNPYSIETSFFLGTTVSFLYGLGQGIIEVFWLRRRFEERALWVKVLVKGSFYLIFIVVFLIVFTIIAVVLRTDASFGDPAVMQEVKVFVSDFSFWSIVIYIAVILNAALFFAEIKEYFGHSTFYNLLFGRYHRPNIEIRIFMFLDMKSSTTIAEKLGHHKYFKLIKQYYADMTQPILDTEGEIYQYVGDEIVVSWLEKKGLDRNNCVECFRKISEAIEGNKELYVSEFGLIPAFKAGYHLGEVTTGEIGIIKKDIIYTGDVLNTTARIQSECNNYNAQALISQELRRKLPEEHNVLFTKIGKLLLRGKSEPMKLYRIDF